MPNHKWYTICCTDCGKTVLYSPYELPMIHNFPVYCHLCAVSHAEVAGFLMPVGSAYSTNGLYGVQNIGKASVLRQKFINRMHSVRKIVSDYKIAKAKQNPIES